MIINTGMRTDIPAFYSEWLMNRVREGFVYVRNPYYRLQVSKYSLSPDVVDCLAFCTKNPYPMLKYIDELKEKYNMFWFITITPYGKDLEPNVPPFEKVKRNASDIRPPTNEEQKQIAKEFVRIGKENNMIIHGCCENPNLKEAKIDITGCMSQEIVEKAIGFNLKAPSGQSKRIVTDGNKEVTKNITLSDKGKPICNCLMGNDIGVYNSCMHLCKYCYANFNKTLVKENYKLHNPNSPFLIGESTPEDKVTEAKQKSWKIENKLEQVTLF